MNDETPDQDDLFEFLAHDAQGRPDPEEHPSIETLSAYGTGRLSEEENDRIQDHLILCRECSGLVLSLKELLRAPLSTPESSPAVTDFEAKRREMEKPAKPVERRPRSVVPAYALAALFALATVGFGFYSHSLRSYLLTPMANLPRVDLSGTERGSTRPSLEIVSGQEKILGFWLDRPYGDASPEYVAEVQAQRGGSPIRVPHLTPDNDWLSFALYSGLLKSGSYDIILKRPDGTTVKTYHFDLVRP